MKYNRSIGADNIITDKEADEIIKILEQHPINTQPKMEGQWVDGDGICPCCGKDKYKDLDADIYADWQPKFCPNCGAKMKLSERRLLLVNKCDLT